MISRNLFREDLFYRINTIVIEVPSLRERGEDIILLAEHFLREYAVRYEKHGLRFNGKTLDKLMRYNWPGNVRELQHAVEKAVILCESGVLTPDDFLISFQGQQAYIGEKAKTLAEIEKQALLTALNNNSGSILKAARELGLARQTMYNKIRKYNL